MLIIALACLLKSIKKQVEGIKVYEQEVGIISVH